MFFSLALCSLNRIFAERKQAKAKTVSSVRQLPIHFEKQMIMIVGEKEYLLLKEALRQDASVSVRINNAKPCPALPFPELIDGSVAWCSDGYYLRKRPLFTFDPLLHAGAYYVQEASSMFLHHVMRNLINSLENPSSPLLMLDMCAAPGGKTTIARATLPEDSLLIANEPITKRAHILSENIQKQGFATTIVTNNYPKDFSQSELLFDIILCDVPCSGEGMFRKDDTAISEWSRANVAKCQELQREIVREAWKCLKPNGTLIYSTCTFNTHENEENIVWMTQELGLATIKIATEETWGVTGSLLKGCDLPVYRFLQSRTRGEGLFVAVLRKEDNGDVVERGNKAIRNKNKDRKRNNMVDLSHYLTNACRFVGVEDNDNIIAIPREWEHIYKTIKQHLHPIHAGIKIGQRKGRDIVPDQSLALAIDFNKKLFPNIELQHDEAIDYLRKEALTLPSDTPRGYVVATYKGLPLGFLKNIGNRANNLYPNEWRIRKR